MYADILRKVKRDCILHDVMLELTYDCNLDCFFCYNEKQADGKVLELADYIRLLDDLEAMQTLNVTLTGGEPLLHPDFFAIGRAARDRGFVVRVKSGGHGLGGRVALRLKQEVNPFAVEISLHGSTAATHDRQTRVDGSFDYLLRNVPELKGIGLRPLLISALTKWNEHQVEEMFEIADGMGVTLRFQGPVVPRDDGDTEPLQIQPSQAGWSHYLSVMDRRQKKSPLACEEAMIREPAGANTPSGADSDPSTPYCGTGSDSVVVDPFGNVYPCLRIRNSAGNLREQTIKSIWHGANALTDARKIAIRTASRAGREGLLSSMGAPIFCPGLELNGCETKCGGCS